MSIRHLFLFASLIASSAFAGDSQIDRRFTKTVINPPIDKSIFTSASK